MSWICPGCLTELPVSLAAVLAWADPARPAAKACACCAARLMVGGRMAHSASNWLSLLVALDSARETPDTPIRPAASTPEAIAAALEVRRLVPWLIWAEKLTALRESEERQEDAKEEARVRAIQRRARLRLETT